MMNPGDIIFVRPAAQDHTGHLIARATSGPYCHVQIVVGHDALGDTVVVEALTHGITRSVRPFDPSPSDVAYVGLLLDDAGLAHGRRWLLSQVGHAYGLLDIAADALRLLLPPALGGRTPFLISPRRYDCSDLATRFLLQAGYRWLPDEAAMNPSQVAPNDLARALHVLRDAPPEMPAQPATAQTAAAQQRQRKAATAS